MRHVAAIARLFPPRVSVWLCAVALTVAVSGTSSPGHAREISAPQLGTRIGGIIAGGPSWRDWKDHFLASDGRVVDTGNKNISHSEGQGYGLLLAVAADDRLAFDHIWSWTRANLGPRVDGLFTWRWSPDPKVPVDRNNATDGDILITWALAEAADHWNDVALRDEAIPIASAIGRKLVASVQGYGPVLLPGLYGFDSQAASDGPIVNLSYWLFPAFHRLAQLAPETDWQAVAQTGMRLIEQARASGRPPADWLSLAKSTPAPALRFPAQFGYDALRIPLYLSLAGSTDPDLLRLFPTAKSGMSIVSARDGSPIEVASGDGYSAVASLIRCAADRTPSSRALTSQKSNDAYYPATLRLLAQIAALADPGSCISAAQAADLRPGEWSRRLPTLPVSPAAILEDRPIAISIPAARPVIAPVEAIEDTSASFDPSWLLVLPLLIAAGLGIVALVRRRTATASLSVANVVVESRRVSPPPARPPLPVPSTARAADNKAVAPPLPPPDAREIAAELHKGGIADNLAAHIHLAAETSAQWQQQVGIIVYAHCGRARAATDDVSRALSALRRTIRAADRVEMIGPTEIGVCVSLLRDDDQLGIVAKRFEGVLRRAFAEAGIAEPPFTSVRTLVSREASASHDVLISLRRLSTRENRKYRQALSAQEATPEPTPEVIESRPKRARPRKTAMVVTAETAATIDTASNTPKKRKRSSVVDPARNGIPPDVVQSNGEGKKAGVKDQRLASGRVPTSFTR